MFVVGSLDNILLLYKCPLSYQVPQLDHFLSYRLQILHGSSYGYSEQITKVIKYISTHNSAIFWATDSRFCMEVHMGGGLQVPSLYQSVPECTSMYQSVTECTRVYQSVPECTRVQQSVLWCTKEYKSALGCTKLFQSVLRYTKVWQSILECTKVYQSVLGYTRLYKFVQKCTRVY